MLLRQSPARAPSKFARAKKYQQPTPMIASKTRRMIGPDFPDFAAGCGGGTGTGNGCGGCVWLYTGDACGGVEIVEAGGGGTETQTDCCGGTGGGGGGGAL